MEILIRHKCLPVQPTVVHRCLDVHAVDRDNTSMLQLHCHVLQRGQTQGDRACTYGILIVCTLKQWIGRKAFPLFSAQNSERKTAEKVHRPHSTYLDIFDNDRKLTACAVSCQQVLTSASEGEELVVEGLEVRLANHQALACSDRMVDMNKQQGRHSLT